MTKYDRRDRFSFVYSFLFPGRYSECVLEANSVLSFLLLFFGEREGRRGKREGGRGAESKHLAGTGIPLLREVIVDEFLE